MDLAAVRAGIAHNLGTITALRVFAYTPESIEPPTAVVGWPTSWEFHTTMANALENAPDIEVFVIVGSAVYRAAQVTLAAYVAESGSQSVRAAIEADPTLNGSVSSSVVDKVDGFRNYVVGNAEYLGCKFHVRVYG